MKLAGIDLNGIHDYAARDWRTDETVNEAESTSNEEAGANHIVDGGTASVAVRVRAKAEVEVVAGPQAILAPHGLGQGWKKIGDQDRRICIADALRKIQKPDTPLDGFHADAIVAAVNTFARDSDLAVFVIPDTKAFDERIQEKLYQIFDQATPRRIELLWRSVALCLGSLSQIESELKNGLRVVGISALGEGVEISELELRVKPSEMITSMAASSRLQYGDKRGSLTIGLVIGRPEGKPCSTRSQI